MGEYEGGEKDLYTFLSFESQRCCTLEIVATDADIRAKVGAAPRTLCNARKRLQEKGLILYRAGRGNRYRYVLCDPTTREPYAGDPRDPITVPKRGRMATPKKPALAVVADQQILPVSTNIPADLFSKEHSRT
jgi:hypothetical protein